MFAADRWLRAMKIVFWTQICCIKCFSIIFSCGLTWTDSCLYGRWVLKLGFTYLNEHTNNTWLYLFVWYLPQKAGYSDDKKKMNIWIRYCTSAANFLLTLGPTFCTNGCLTPLTGKRHHFNTETRARSFCQPWEALKLQLIVIWKVK